MTGNSINFNLKAHSLNNGDSKKPSLHSEGYSDTYHLPVPGKNRASIPGPTWEPVKGS